MRDVWWLFYPITGLQITDKTDRFDKPLFGDALLLSKDLLPSTVGRLGLNSETSDYDHEKDVRYLLSRGPRDFHSYLVVRRSGAMPGHHPRERSDKMTDSATERARIIASLLTVVLLSESRSGVTCGLTEEITDPLRRNVGALNFEKPGFSYQNLASDVGMSRIVWNEQQRISMSTQELGELFRREPYSALTKVIIGQRTTVSFSTVLRTFRAHGERGIAV